MTWEELRANIIRLGFESATDSSVLSEYGNNIIDAANRSLEFNCTFYPVIKKYDFTKTTDLIERVPISGKVDHVTVEDTDAVTLLPYSNYVTENDNTLVFFESGVYHIFYEGLPDVITVSTADTTEIPVDDDVRPLIALLAAYYVWLDDDERKAVMYYNQWQEMKTLIDTKRNNEMRSIKGTIIGGF